MNSASCQTYKGMHVFAIFNAKYFPADTRKEHIYSKVTLTLTDVDLDSNKWFGLAFILWRAPINSYMYLLWREKGRDLTKSYDKSPYTHRKIQNATRQHKNATKNFDYTIIEADLRQSVGVMIVIQLVWLNRFYGITTFSLRENLNLKSCQNSVL